MVQRTRSKLSASIVLLVLGVGAAFLLFADSRAARMRLGGSQAEPGLLPPLAAGPAIGVVPDVDVEVRLSGTIRNTSSEPIAGAFVCAACTNHVLALDRAAQSCTQTDARGMYTLGALPRGDYLLSAGAAGYLPGALHGGAVLRVGPTGLRAEDLDGVLERGGARVTGSVVDGTGGPIAGARVEAHFAADTSRPGVLLLQAAVSNDDGGFSIWVPRGDVRLMSHAEGYAAGNIYSFAPATDVQLVMTPSAEIAGHVVTAKDGQPVANVRVNAVQHGVRQFAISDDRGAFRITHLDPGTFNLTAQAKGWYGQHSGSVTLEIAERVEDVLVHVVPAPSVQGVLLAGERPCTSGHAQLAPQPGEALPSFVAGTDTEGKVTFEAVVPGHYEASATCDGYEPLTGSRVTIGLDDVRGLVWRFESTAEVTIVAKTSGGMIAEATWIDFERIVESQSPAASTPRLRGEWTDANGKVHFKGVPAGHHRISGPDITQPLSIEVREGNNRFDVAIDARGYIDVHVKRPNGEPNDDVGMFALRVDGTGVPGDAHRYDTGRYRIGPLSVGPHYVQIRDGVNPAARSDGDVHVRAGAITEIEMVYGGDSGRITGRVLDASGQPLANAWVSVEASDSASDMLTQGLQHDMRAKQRRVYTDAQGRFEIASLESRGQFSVVVTRRGGGEERRSGVSPGQYVEVVLPESATLEGIALAADGTPLRDFRLSLQSEHTRQNIAPIFGPEANGAWQLRDIAPGQVTLTAFTMNGEQGSAVVSVTPGQTRGAIVLKIAPLQAALRPPTEQHLSATPPRESAATEHQQ